MLFVTPIHWWTGQVVAPDELAFKPLITQEVGSATCAIAEAALATAGL